MSWKAKLLYSKGSIALQSFTSMGKKSSFVFRGQDQSMKGENQFPGANKSFCVSLSLLSKVKAKVLRHSTIGQNNILCSAHHIPTQAKCLWVYFFKFQSLLIKVYQKGTGRAVCFCSSLEGFNGRRTLSKSIYFKAGMKQTWQMGF